MYQFWSLPAHHCTFTSAPTAALWTTVFQTWVFIFHTSAFIYNSSAKFSWTQATVLSSKRWHVPNCTGTCSCCSSAVCLLIGSNTSPTTTRRHRTVWGFQVPTQPTHPATWKQAGKDLPMFMHVAFYMMFMTDQCSGWKMTNSNKLFCDQINSSGGGERGEMGNMEGSIGRETEFVLS